MARPIGSIAIAVLLVATLWLSPTRLVTAEEQMPDVRVIIDVSGSMKRTDPQNLRKPALELIVELIPDGAQAGVWTFGKMVNMLVPHKPVNNEWRKQAKKAATEINSVALFTNIGAAIEKASYDFGKLKPGYKTSYIFLTDGVVDISRSPEENKKERDRIINELIPKLKAQGGKVHTIALSSNADHELMERISVATDGVVAVANSADELMKIFVKAFDQAAPVEKVPLAENKFLVDSSIDEFTALVYRKKSGTETKVKGPDEELYNQSTKDKYVKWFRGDSYDLVTIQQPLEGEWQLVADIDPDNRVTIVSNLSMQVSPFDNNLFGNIPEVTLQLTEEGKVIKRKEFLGLLTIDLNVKRQEDGKVWQDTLSKPSAPPADGIYKTELAMLNEVGTYDIKLSLDGKTFQRQFAKTVSVRAPFKVAFKEDSGMFGNKLIISMVPLEGSIDPEKTKVTAHLTKPGAESEEVQLSVESDQSWQASFSPKVDGDYSAKVSIEGSDMKGNKLSVNTADITYSYVADKTKAKEPEPVAEPAPEPKPEPKPEPEPEPEPIAEPPAVEPPAEPAEKIDWLLWGGLGVGNILVIVLGYLAYRMLKGRGEPLEELTEEEDEEIEEKEEPEEVDDMDNEDEDDDDGLDGMDADLDETAVETKKPKPKPTPKPKVVEEPEEEEEEEEEKDDPLMADFDEEDFEAEDLDDDTSFGPDTSVETTDVDLGEGEGEGGDDDEDFDFEDDDEYSLDDFAIDDEEGDDDDDDK